MNHNPSNHVQFTGTVRTLTLLSALALALAGSTGAEKQPSGIPFSQIGAKATADYRGDDLAITGTAEGARLKCGFQKLEGRATAEGLWLESSPEGGGKFRVLAMAVGRKVLECGSPVPLSPDASALKSGRGLSHSKTLSRSTGCLDGSGLKPLASTGEVSLADKLVRFIRPELTEEYSVSVDGVRQDFVVTEKPAGEGELQVGLVVAGAGVETMRDGEWGQASIFPLPTRNRRWDCEDWRGCSCFPLLRRRKLGPWACRSAGARRCQAQEETVKGIGKHRGLTPFPFPFPLSLSSARQPLRRATNMTWPGD